MQLLKDKKALHDKNKKWKSSTETLAASNLNSDSLDNSIENSNDDSNRGNQFNIISYD